MVAQTIFNEVICDKLFDNSIQKLYMRCCMNLAAYPVNILSPQFVDLGLTITDALDKGASLWTPSTRVEMPKDVTHLEITGSYLWKTTAVGDDVIANS